MTIPQLDNISQDLALALRTGRATEIVLNDENGPVASFGAPAEVLKQLADHITAPARHTEENNA